MGFIMQFRVGTRLATGFGLLLILMTGLSLVGVSRMSLMQEKVNRIVGEDSARIELLGEMRDQVRVQAVALRDIVLQEDLAFKKSELKRMKEARAQYQKAAEQLAAAVSDAAGKASIERIKAAELAIQPAVEKALDLSLSDQHLEAARVVREQVRETQIALVKELDQMRQYLQEGSRESAAATTSAYKSGSELVLLLGVAAFAIGALAALFITRSITTPLKAAADLATHVAAGDLTVDIEVSRHHQDETARVLVAMHAMVERLRAMISQITRFTGDLAGSAEGMRAITERTRAGVRRQQLETDQVATAMTEMTSTAQEVAHSAANAAQAAAQATHEAQAGHAVVTQTSRAIDALASEVERAAQAIEKLEQDTSSIGVVLDVIRGIAEQTNLLALNAAIEAARAGEQGRGFAVVADEVRTLASRTQQSTQEIRQMIERLQGAAQQAVGVMQASRQSAQAGVEQAARAGGSLDSITRAVGTINDMNTQIATAAEEQCSVAEEMNRNIANITSIAEETATGSDETAHASDQLNRLAEGLRLAVGHFRI